MPKGKKFTAAEKHFQGKIDKLNKSIKALRVTVASQYDRISELEIENSKLRKSIELQMEANKVLQEMSKLSNEDLENAIKHNAEIKEIAPMIIKLLKGEFPVW